VLDNGELCGSTTWTRVFLGKLHHFLYRPMLTIVLKMFWSAFLSFILYFLIFVSFFLKPLKLVLFKLTGTPSFGFEGILLEAALACDFDASNQQQGGMIGSRWRLTS